MVKRGSLGGFEVTTVGARDLKNRLIAFLRRVAGTERIIVTDRGVAVIVLPDTPADHERVAGMVREGLAAWGGGKPRGLARPVRVRGKPVSQTVIEERR